MKSDNTDSDFLKKAFNRAVFFLKFRPRSEREVRQNLLVYFAKKKISPQDYEQVIIITIDRLKNLNFINDRDFIHYWVERRFRENPKGKRIIIDELRQKGIKDDLIEEAVDSELKSYSQEEVVKKLIEKADRRYKSLPLFERKQKLLNFILRRGFSFSEVNKTIDEMTKKQ